MSTQASTENDKLHQMLEKLKEESKAIENGISDWISSFSDKVKNIEKKAVDSACDTTNAINESVHNHPWRYIAGAAVGAFLCGFFVRK